MSNNLPFNEPQPGYNPIPKPDPYVVTKTATTACATVFTNFVITDPKRGVLICVKDVMEGKYQYEVEAVRELFKQGKKEEAEKLKRLLPAFTPSALFAGGRKQENMTDYGGYIILDFDDLTAEQIKSAKLCAKFDPYTMACFVSPSGMGLKIIAEVNTGARQHEQAYNQVCAYYERVTALKADRSGKDITRLCFFSYDPEGYRTTENKIFKVDSCELLVESAPAATGHGEPSRSIGTKVDSEASRLSREPCAVPAHALRQAQGDPCSDNINEEDLTFPLAYDNAVTLTRLGQPFTEGNRNNFVYQLACNCNRAGIEQDMALTFIISDFGYDEKEVEQAVNSAYKNHTNEFGLKKGLFVDSCELIEADMLTTYNYQPLTQNENQTTTNEQLSTNEFLNSPTIPDSVFTNLPQLLDAGCNAFDGKRERDIFLTGALSILSGCFTALSGTYDRKTVYPGLFSFVVAPPASGKHSLSMAKQLGQKIHNTLLQNSREQMERYEINLEQFKNTSKKKNKTIADIQEEQPVKPKFKTLYFPANSSSAAIINHLEQNEGSGIICETEADTLGSTLKQDWGGYSDLIRKSFHHETVSCSRRTNNVYIQIENPRLAIALSGTPGQVAGLISSAEDGSFSRFIFYCFKEKPYWRDVSEGNRINLTVHFTQLADEVERMCGFLNNNPTIFSLTEGQWNTLNVRFAELLKEVSTFIAEEATSTVKRLGLVVFRICMVLTAMRKYEDGLAEQQVICTDTDFNTALALAEVYLQHAMLMFRTLPKGNTKGLSDKKKRFYEALPTGRKFTRKEAVEIGVKLNMKKTTVDNMLNNLNDYLIQPEYGYYCKK